MNFVYAQTFQSISSSIVKNVNLLVAPIFILASILFLWGIILYLTGGGDEEKRRDGKKFMIYGLVALFVMVSAWGLIAIVIDFFFGPSSGSPPGLHGPISPGDIPGF